MAHITLMGSNVELVFINVTLSRRYCIKYSAKDKKPIDRKQEAIENKKRYIEPFLD